MTTVTTLRRALRLSQVQERTTLSKTQIYRLLKKAQFPQPTRLSDRLVVWNEIDIDEWLANKFNSTAQVVEG